MTTAIVTVNASVVQAPTPTTLQQSGVLVTQGGTDTIANTLTQISTLAAGEAILGSPKTLGNLTWSGNLATGTTEAAHGWGDGDVVLATVAAASPSGYNYSGSITVTGAETFTYPVASNPGSATEYGTVVLNSVNELEQMLTTYFAGNGVPAISVLELGEGDPAAGPPLLATFVADVLGAPSQQYGYLIPREWDNISAFVSAFLPNYTAPNKKVYFFVTTTLANRAVYAGLKCVLAEVESPNIAATEFSLASAFGTALKQQPSSSNPASPLTLAPSFGTTAYPVQGNQTLLGELATANVGWIASGQEGGVSGNIIKQGKLSDGNFWNFWYSVDWAQINMDLAIANEVINGAAGGPNPLWYNQPGVNRLQNRVLQVAQQGVTAMLGNGQVIPQMLPAAQFQANISAGMYAGQIVVNAEPALVFAAENPSDYGDGVYAGLSCLWIPQNPFLGIVFGLQATTLLVGG